MDTAAAAYEYLRVVFINWWWIVTAILFVLDKTLEWAWPNYRFWLNQTFPATTRRRYFWRALFAFMFVAGFFAWKDEHNKVGEKQVEIDRQAGELREAIGAKQEVEKLQSEVAALHKNIQSRQLSPDEERELLRSLSTIGLYGVIVNHENGDDEAYSFAENLVSVFKSIPGWKVNGSNFMTILGPRETGVLIIVSDQGEVPQAAVIVMASLRRERIAFSLKKRAPTPENYLGPRVFEVFVRSRS